MVDNKKVIKEENIENPEQSQEPAKFINLEVTAETKAKKLSHFHMILKKENGKDIFYKMTYQKNDESSFNSYRVDYYYGAVGSNGKHYFKFFTDFSDSQGKSAEERAKEFLELKYQELLFKGYSEASNIASTKYTVEPGKTIYMEWKDKYTSEKSFYEIARTECGYFIRVREGDIGGRVGEENYNMDADFLFPFEGWVTDCVENHLSRGFRIKQTTPKSIQKRFVDPFGFNGDPGLEADNVSEDESDTDSRPVKRLKRKI